MICRFYGFMFFASVIGVCLDFHLEPLWQLLKSQDLWGL
jgi:hypothetical protein